MQHPHLIGDRMIRFQKQYFTQKLETLEQRTPPPRQTI